MFSKLRELGYVWNGIREDVAYAGPDVILREFDIWLRSLNEPHLEDILSGGFVFLTPYGWSAVGIGLLQNKLNRKLYNR